MIYIIWYLTIINIIAYVFYGVDKYKAKKHLWRISETALIFIAVIGGSIGAFMGMKIFHHKTKHPKFYIGLPIIILLQIIISVVVITQLPRF